MKYSYKTTGVCASRIDFEIEASRVHNVHFHGGCDGNQKAVGILVEGMEADELIKKLAGNKCGFKQTSCADQLARAVGEAIEQEK